MKTEEWIWCNGWVESASLPFDENRSFLFGDGFFETMHWHDGRQCILWKHHWHRIIKSSTALHFPWPGHLSESNFRRLIEERIPLDPTQHWKVKIVFWRQGKGKYSPESTQLAFCLLVDPYPAQWIRLIYNTSVAQSVTIPRHPFSWIKTTSALLYVMAGMERSQHGADEMILTDPNGYIVEGSFSCVFWSKSGSLFLPHPDLGGLHSCMRHFLEEYWESRGIPFLQVKATHLEIEQADWVGFGNGMGLLIKPNRAMPNRNVLPFDLPPKV